jgi:tetratricopeptide (TPR) repeat protein
VSAFDEPFALRDARQLLGIYVDLREREVQPLHAQGLAFHLAGAFDVIDPWLSVFGMWTPVRYREHLIEALDGAAQIQAKPIGPAVTSSRNTDEKRLQIRDAVTLCKVGDYHRLQRQRQGASVVQFVAAHARLFVGGSWQEFEHAMQRIDAGSLLGQHALRVATVSGLVRQHQAEKAAEIVAEDRRQLGDTPGTRKDIDRLCILRNDSLQGSVLWAAGRSEGAINTWIECVNAALHTPAQDGLQNWLFSEFARRRLERIVRELVQLGDCTAAKKYVEECVSIDPFDGRAWRLFAEASVLTNPTQACLAYRHAIFLDPTLRRSCLPALLTVEALTPRRYAGVGTALRSPLDIVTQERFKSNLRPQLEGFPPPVKQWLLTGREDWLFHLFRPVFDLGERREGPIMTQAPLAAYERWASGDWNHWTPNIQRVVMPAHRRALCKRAKLEPYDITHPKQLPADLATPKWWSLTKRLREWKSTGDEERVRLLGILICLGLHECVLSLSSEYSLTNELSYSSAGFEIANVGAFADYMLSYRGTHQDAATRRFRLVAHKAPMGTRARFSACLTLAVHAAKQKRSLVETQDWLDASAASLRALQDKSPSEHANLIWESRYLRAAAFVPFLQNDTTRSLKLLYQALETTSKRQAESPSELLVQQENRLTLLQTIVKSILHSGSDIATALCCAEEYVRIDPWDFGARLELGDLYFHSRRLEDALQQYELAACLGPPGEEIGSFMSGQVLLQMEDPDGAAQSFIDALQCDPSGSSTQALRAMDKAGQLNSLRHFGQLFH